LCTPSVFAPALPGAQHARTGIGAVHSLQRGVDGLLILGERTGSQKRNDLNISLPSHCCPTPCIQASITLTLEASTVAHPDIELTMTGWRRPMRARRASPQEKAELWPRVVAAYAGYGGYQRRTERDIPLVICEPR
jgi:F420H(2)-dependent quinone reductase